MTEIGYPDFGRHKQTQLLPVIELNQNVVAEYLGPVYYIGDTPYMEIDWDCTGLSDHYFVQLIFSDDSAGVTGSGNSAVTTVPGYTGWIPYKSKGRYVQLEVQNKEATDTGNVIIYVRGADQPPGPYESQYQAVPLISSYTSGVAAGASEQVDATTTIPGPATLCFRQGNNNSWQGLLWYYDWDQTAWIRLAWLDGADYGQSATVQVNLPAAPVRVQMYNNDTVSRSLFFALTT